MSSGTLTLRSGLLLLSLLLAACRQDGRVERHIFYSRHSEHFSYSVNIVSVDGAAKTKAMHSGGSFAIGYDKFEVILKATRPLQDPENIDFSLAIWTSTAGQLGVKWKELRMASCATLFGSAGALVVPQFVRAEVERLQHPAKAVLYLFSLGESAPACLDVEVPISDAVGNEYVLRFDAKRDSRDGPLETSAGSGTATGAEQSVAPGGGCPPLRDLRYIETHEALSKEQIASASCFVALSEGPAAASESEKFITVVYKAVMPLFPGETVLHFYRQVGNGYFLHGIYRETQFARFEVFPSAAGTKNVLVCSDFAAGCNHIAFGVVGGRVVPIWEHSGK